RLRRGSKHDAARDRVRSTVIYGVDRRFAARPLRRTANVQRDPARRADRVPHAFVDDGTAGAADTQIGRRSAVRDRSFLGGAPDIRGSGLVRLESVEVPALSLSPGFSLPFRILEPLRQLRVVLAVKRPPAGGTVPAVVRDGHVDAAVDEKSHRVVAAIE